MNEVTRVHLGRTAFTISVDAHKALQSYLDAIKRHVGSKHQEVLDEVELRMAELLTERGVTGDKVIMAKDVEFLQEQLGSPSEFQDDSEEVTESAGETRSRRLFRDPRGSILGGVASGLGTYFGIDAWIIRVIFIGLTFAGASGIFFYLLLWLLVPRAKSNGDFLQMAGKPVTVEALTDYVESEKFKQDTKRAANRFSAVLTEMGQLFVRFCGYAIGTTLIVIALVSSIWTIITGTYVLTNPERLTDAGRIFPIGSQEVGLIILSMAVLIGLFALMFSAGLAFLQHKWRLPIWATVTLSVFVIAGLAVSGGLVAQTVPRVHDRYEATRRTETRPLPTFNAVMISPDTKVRYEPAAKSSVEIQTAGTKHVKGIKTNVKDNVLNIDTSNFRAESGCSWLCLNTSEITVIVHAPQLVNVTVGGNASFIADNIPAQDSLTIISDRSAVVDLRNLAARSASLTSDRSDSQRTFVLNGITKGSPENGRWTHTGYTSYTLGQTDEFKLNTLASCDLYDPQTVLLQMPKVLIVNSQRFESEDSLRRAQSEDKSVDVNCVVVRSAVNGQPYFL